MNEPSGLAGVRLRWSFGLAAWLLICQCAAVPAVSRAFDRLTLYDNAGGFRFSKNLERPHEKHSAPSLGIVAAVMAGAPPLPGADGPTPVASPFLSTRPSLSPALRAPPAR